MNNTRHSDFESEDRYHGAQAGQSHFAASPQARFAAMLEIKQESEEGYDDIAFAYGEHRQDFKRDRSFSASHFGDEDSLDLGHEEMGFARIEDHWCMHIDEEDPELDLDDLNDFLSFTQEKSKITLVPHERSDEARATRPEDNVFVGERDDCCGNQTQQPDFAFDSTYHSLHEHESTFEFVGQNLLEASAMNGSLSFMKGCPLRESPMMIIDTNDQQCGNPFQIQDTDSLNVP